MVLLRKVIGDALRARRLAQHRTLREVSTAANVSLGYLSEIERGHKEASSELLASICEALGARCPRCSARSATTFALAEQMEEAFAAPSAGAAEPPTAPAPRRRGHARPGCRMSRSCRRRGHRRGAQRRPAADDAHGQAAHAGPAPHRRAPHRLSRRLSVARVRRTSAQVPASSPAVTVGSWAAKIEGPDPAASDGARRESTERTRTMANPFVKGWKYLMALFGSKIDEHADPKVQIQQAIEDAQRQHQALVQQAAAVIGNQRQLEMKLSRQLTEVETLQANARQALVLADRARAERRHREGCRTTSRPRRRSPPSWSRPRARWRT